MKVTVHHKVHYSQFTLTWLLFQQASTVKAAHSSYCRLIGFHSKSTVNTTVQCCKFAMHSGKVLRLL